jgi:hypothetical protein
MIGLTELIIILFIVFVPIWLIAFLDILRNDFKGNEKLVWLLAVILVPFLGPIFYFYFGWKQKIRGKTDGG